MRSPVGVVRLERVAAVQPGIVSRVLARQAATDVPPFVLDRLLSGSSA